MPVNRKELEQIEKLAQRLIAVAGPVATSTGSSQKRDDCRVRSAYGDFVFGLNKIQKLLGKA